MKKGFYAASFLRQIWLPKKESAKQNEKKNQKEEKHSQDNESKKFNNGKIIKVFPPLSSK